MKKYVQKAPTIPSACAPYRIYHGISSLGPSLCPGLAIRPANLSENDCKIVDERNVSLFLRESMMPKPMMSNNNNNLFSLKRSCRKVRYFIANKEKKRISRSKQIPFISYFCISLKQNIHTKCLLYVHCIVASIFSLFLWLPMNSIYICIYIYTISGSYVRFALGEW